ncbi:hypothetical protein Vch1786_II0702 [Vibrio cholerae O1 str. 2010EL-1786]|uniref:Uncharacterized protein n=2 Tax=Vibrio cholerae TaxID=666 RepID=Q9KKT6_VIBCH|nr:hypothetical protein VC_A1014 [Vibrio cholerae O1 biovar El Tor str. N16961]ACP07932.1 conserved hypothetical protein [Vibrio cholerae M66-2]ACP11868.1 conserved hypothetical protein [Vibrio cholerae O395]AET29120.1 hypothetical protein Vch1786_II0702 [Vibrio cholerae O1 str. 2010EL-1786]
MFIHHFLERCDLLNIRKGFYSIGGVKWFVVALG